MMIKQYSVGQELILRDLKNVLAVDTASPEFLQEVIESLLKSKELQAALSDDAEIGFLKYGVHVNLWGAWSKLRGLETHLSTKDSGSSSQETHIYLDQSILTWRNKDGQTLEGFLSL